MGRVRANKLAVGALVLSLTAALAGCASQFERSFEQADQLRQQAAAAGYEWLGTADLLQAAREASAAGDTKAALALVDEASFQAEAALQQAEQESEAWKRRVLK